MRKERDDVILLKTGEAKEPCLGSVIAVFEVLFLLSACFPFQARLVQTVRASAIHAEDSGSNPLPLLKILVIDICNIVLFCR